MTLRDLSAHALGLSWTLDEPMRRTSHALVDEGRVWLVDPVDEPDALARVATLGEPQAVLQLLDRHGRDCVEIARRLGVRHLRPGGELPGTPFTAHAVIRRRFWNEIALWWPDRRALVVAEAVGTHPIYTVGSGPVGVHPLLRLTPPRSLARFEAAHLLAGHGEPLHGPGTAAAIRDALDRSRRDLPRLVARLPAFARGG